MRAILISLLFLGCQSGDSADEDVARGRGLPVATLPTAAQARVYEAVLRAAFDVEPSLTLLLHPRLLPRAAGVAGGSPVPAELADALRRRGIVAGSCEPPDSVGARATPRCAASAPGYVVRFSDVFQQAPDSVQVYLMAERYDTPTSGAHEALHFEKAYQLVGRSGAWRVVGEARVPESAPPADAP